MLAVSVELFYMLPVWDMEEMHVGQADRVKGDGHIRLPLRSEQNDRRVATTGETSNLTVCSKIGKKLVDVIFSEMLSEGMHGLSISACGGVLTGKSDQDVTEALETI